MDTAGGQAADDWRELKLKQEAPHRQQQALPREDWLRRLGKDRDAWRGLHLAAPQQIDYPWRRPAGGPPHVRCQQTIAQRYAAERYLGRKALEASSVSLGAQCLLAFHRRRREVVIRVA